MNQSITRFSRFVMGTPWDDRELHDSWQGPNSDELWFVDWCSMGGFQRFAVADTGLLWNLQYNVNMLFVNLSGHHHIRSNLINHTRKLTIMWCTILQGSYNATLSPYWVIKLWQITVTTVQNITSPKTRMFRILIPHTCDTIATTNLIWRKSNGGP